MKLSNVDIIAIDKPIKDFPAVTVDQRNYRISEIIRRNLAGEQVLGNNNLSYDYTNADQNYDPEKINPFNKPGFDLDDVIVLARENGQRVTDLQNQYGELKLALDKARKEETEKKTVVVNTDQAQNT